MRTLCGRMRQPLRIASVPITATGTTGAPVSSASRPTPRLRAAERAGPDARALGEDQDGVAAREDRLRGLEHVLVALAAVDREGAERVEEPAVKPAAGTAPPWRRSTAAAARSWRSRTGPGTSGGWRRGSPGRSRARARARSATAGSRGGRTAAGPRADEPVDERVDALARGRGRAGGCDRRCSHGCSSTGHTRRAAARYSWRAWPSTATRTLRGALAGAAAAAVWAAQQPLDKRVFGVDYDDAELLGKLVTRGRAPATRPVGLAAARRQRRAFGALYANVAPSLPGPRAVRGAGRRAGRAPRDLAGARCVIDRWRSAAATSRSCGATRARSRRRPGATCSSAPCWASSSGG